VGFNLTCVFIFGFERSVTFFAYGFVYAFFFVFGVGAHESRAHLAGIVVAGGALGVNVARSAHPVQAHGLAAFDVLLDPVAGRAKHFGAHGWCLFKLVNNNDQK